MWPVHGACLGEWPWPHSQNPCSADTLWTCCGRPMHNEGPEGPYGESSATCAQCGASNVHSSLWQIKPDCLNCCYKAPNSAAAGSLGHISSPLHLLQPSVNCNPVSGQSSSLPRSTFSAAKGVPRLYFPLGAAPSTHWSAYLLASGSTSFRFGTPADEQAIN